MILFYFNTSSRALSVGRVLLASNNLHVQGMITGYASRALSRSFVHGHKMGKVTNCNALLIILIENAQASHNIIFMMLLTGDIHAQKKYSPARELALSLAPSC